MTKLYVIRINQGGILIDKEKDVPVLFSDLAAAERLAKQRNTLYKETAVVKEVEIYEV